MEELLEIKYLIKTGKYDDAYNLVEYLEEMGKKGLESNIRSYAKILLLHLIKQKIEQRTTKSWDAAIRNAIIEIKALNARPKGKGNYLNNEELEITVCEAMDGAIDKAALEVKEGIYNYCQIEQEIDRQELMRIALQLIQS